MNTCADCGGPVFAEVMRGGVGVPMCEACFDARPFLPTLFAALADGPTNDGTRTGPPPRACMLTRDEAERIIKTARAIVAAGPVMELAAGYTLIRSTLITELAAALDATNIGA